MASSALETLSLIPDPSFNWFFLLELIVSCILVLFFLLYFNRLFATLLSYGIRAYTWHYYRAYVDIHALQISLLGGRIFFKGIRYHGVNETIFVHGGFITWHYWKRAVRRNGLSQLQSSKARTEGDNQESDGPESSIGEKGGLESPESLPCRITVKFYGLEWFIYNRTPAYDSILAGFSSARPSSTSSQSRDSGSDEIDPSLKEKTPDPIPNTEAGPAPALDHDFLRNATGRDTVGPEDAQGPTQEFGDSLSRLLRLLPLKLECDKGALVMGNEHTRSVLTITFDAATGLVEASPAGPLDLYRQIFSFKFNHPMVQMRPNPDFKQGQLAAARGLNSAREDQKPGTKRKRDTIFNYQFQKRRVWHSIRDLIPYFQTSVESFHIMNKRADLGPRNQSDLRNDSRWVGLSRYLDDSSQDDHGEWDAIEYGRFSTILDSPSMSITYFWDIPGVVVADPLANENPAQKSSSSTINLARPPEWGIDVKLEGGAINYGPWSDRERVGLQNIFFPSAFRSSEPAEPLTAGDLRQSSVFKLTVEISKEMTLRIPTREPSKDWLWKGRADAVRGASKLKKKQQRRQARSAEGEKGPIGPDIRPFGWLSLRVAPDSTINYTMDMVASASGFGTRLDLDLCGSRMTSSVNHAVLWQCPRQLITCDLSVPLSWNTLRTWKFDVESRDMQLFLLRDHVFLLTDLITDWASGPPQEYYAFVPFIYKLNMSFTDIQLFLNVNDSNIISDPADLDDNRLLVIKGRKLTSDISIPLNKYCPEQNAVSFNVNLLDARIDFLAPMWDTLATFLKNKSMATLENLVIDGTYNYFLTTSDELVDTLLLNIDGLSPRLYLFGFLIKCFMILKENYFGEEVHFRTLEEFQEIAYSQEEPEAHNGINPNRKTNDLDVVLHVNVGSACALLPESLYDDLNYTRLTSPSLEVDLRFTNYYMDMQFSLAPLSASLDMHQNKEHPALGDTQLFIDGASIYGHRIFGQPPVEPTYVCNWDFDIGRIFGECSPRFLSCLAAGLQSFDVSFDNEENALPPLFPLVLHDVTFLRAKFNSFHISVLLDSAALLLSTGSVTTKFNDWANARFSKRMSLLVPDLSISAIDYKFLGRFGTLIQSQALPLALFRTSIRLKMAQRKNNIVESRRSQQEHIKLHDQRTQRTPWLLFDWEEVEPDSMHLKYQRDISPTIAIPTMPEPIAGRLSELDSSPVKHPSGTQSGASSRSFLLGQDRVSIQKRGKKGPRSFDEASSVSSKAAKVHGVTQQATRNRTPYSLGERKSFTKDMQNSSDALNPWSMPKFSLHRIKLDTSQLPLGQVPIDGAAHDASPVTTFDPRFSPLEDDKTTHTNFMIDLPSGIRGVCTPEFLFIVSALLESLQPRHPVGIIDSLQKDVISDIVGYEKSLKNPRKATAAALKAPFILVKMINASESSKGNEAGFRDEYTVEVSNIKTAFRTQVERQKGDLLAGISKTSSMHTAADSISVSVESSRVDAYQQKSEFTCRLGDVSFWLVTAPFLRSNLQIRAFDTITSTKSVEQLAFLVRRTTTMFDSAASSFQHNSSLSHKRMRFLIYFLTQPAAIIPDPTFLTRISYVLRIAPGHLRQHDSWKILSRIRNVYNNLSPAQQQDLISKFSKDDLALPFNAKSTVVSSFDQWRAWDLAHVEKSYVMRRVWESFEPKSAASPPEVCLSSTIKLLRFSIDPGPKESDFVIQNLSTVISTRPKTNGSASPERAHNSCIVVQSYCSAISLRLRWEILDLVEEVVKTMSPVTLESAKTDRDSGSEAESQNGLQLIFGADLGSVTLDGINVKLALIGKALRSSVVLEPQNSEGLDIMSVMTSAEAGSLELSNLSTTLMQWKVHEPHFYCSRTTEQAVTGVKHDWKIAGSSRKLRYDIKEDPLSLAHTADRLIEDEIQFIYQLIKNLDLPASQPADRPSNRNSAQNKFQIAIFLDDYKLSFCILPSLAYIISGEVARASIISKMESKIEVDFDLKKNLHTFQSNEGGKWRPLSELGIPPINGRVIANMGPDHTDMEVDVTIELIQLEASALRSLLGVLTRPEFSHLASDLKQNMEVLKLHCSEVLALDNSNLQQEDTSNPSTILYKARMTMAGTRIHAIAPGLDGKGYSTDMGLSLGMMRMRLNNGLDDGRPMEFPEFHVDTSNISFDLRKQEGLKGRSYCSFAADAKVKGTSVVHENGKTMRVFHFTSNNFDIELFPETAALVVDIAAHLQERIKKLDLSHEVKRFKKLRHRGHSEAKSKSSELPNIEVQDFDPEQEDLFDAIYSLDLNNIQIGWNMASAPQTKLQRRPDDLVFSIKRVDLSNKRTNSAKLRIEDVQLQMVPFSGDRRVRSLNSALMPEVVFNVAYSSIGKDVRLAFQAAGKSLDLRATSDFILPGSMIRESIASAAKTIRDANSRFVSKETEGNVKPRALFGNKRVRSVLVDVDFAGAIVTLQGRQTNDPQTLLTATLKGRRMSESNYGQYVQGDAIATATLRAPGVALKVQFEDNANDDSTLNAELKIDASKNVLYPSLVPLIRQMSTTVKEVMGDPQKPRRPSTTMMLQPQRLMQETPLNDDPNSILGRCKLNVGLSIRKQEFSLSCQPIARVAATAAFESVYVAINTVQSDDHGRFLALSVVFNSLGASVKHVYSNESTASFEVKSMVMSLMNSKHLGRAKGISAVLRVSPMQVALNAKQVQDLLLFREIWIPSSEDMDSAPAFEPQPSETQAYIVQRYQQVASAPAFPWNSTIAIEKLEIQLDLGSTLGKAQFAIDDLWLSSKKTSDREQILCIGFKSTAIESKGRMSGLVELQTLKIRTSINWPDDNPHSQTPLIQALISFHQLQVKLSFDYQPFLIAHIAKFDFLMYNVRSVFSGSNERLFSILEGDQVQVFCTSLTASQCLALFQAWQRLAQDKQAAYEASLREVERYLRRKTSVFAEKIDLSPREVAKKTDENMEKAPISLQTGVVVTIKAVHIGAFPSTLFDNHVFKLEAHDAQARFDVSLDRGKIHSALGLTLGQLRVALSPITRSGPVAIEDLHVDEIATRVIGSRGGTILNVPRLVAVMETWQVPGTHQIDYIFRSTFEGKVDVGWNYSRISFIRDMWETHSRALASRLGKPLPPSAVRITGGLPAEGGGTEQQEKITAVVNVPQSKYTYVAIEPPVIETPQLRDMGEATPPLEWIGLQREKLPNVTHQIIIVTLLEIAKEVEDAYGKILWSS